MGFRGGDKNINRAGKPKGATNHTTRQVKEAFGKLLEGNLDAMTLWLSDIAADDPAKAFDLMIRLSERFVPRLAQTQITDGDGGDIFKNVSFNFGSPIDSPDRDQENPDLKEWDLDDTVDE